jgi:dihydroneopterin aldolase
MANTTDYTFIENLRVSGKHGVADHERKIEQEFAFDIKMEFDTKAAAQSDVLSDALDYVPVRDRVVEIVQGQSFYLIERLGETICNEILKDKRIKKVELKIRKTAVWDNGVPGVVLMRENR